MGDLGDGTIYADLADVLEELDTVLIELQHKTNDLAAVNGVEDSDDDDD